MPGSTSGYPAERGEPSSDPKDAERGTFPSGEARGASLHLEAVGHHPRARDVDDFPTTDCTLQSPGLTRFVLAMLGVCEDERTGHKLASNHIPKTSRSR